MLWEIYYRICCQKDKKEKTFLILADEASDCPNQNQLSLVIRYVDSDCVIREVFLGFLHCEIVFRKAMTEMQQFLDILMGYRHIIVELTAKQYIRRATVTVLI